MITDKVRATHAAVAEQCAHIAGFFKPDARITVLIRNPSLPDGDMVVSDDSMDLAIEALARLKDREEKKLSLEDMF